MYLQTLHAYQSFTELKFRIIDVIMKIQSQSSRIETINNTQNIKHGLIKFSETKKVGQDFPFRNK